MKKIIIIALAILVVFAATLSANGAQESNGSYGGGQGTGQGAKDGSGRGTGQGNGQGQGQGGGRGNAAGQLYHENFSEELTQAYGIEPGSGVLSSEDKDGLMLMVEEEKLARDVYSALYEKWRTPIFSNIAESEQQHMDAVKLLLEAYEVSIPAELTTAGTFQNTELQKHYDNLTAQGSESLIEALNVGTLIEDLDIADLQRLIESSENDEVKLLYQNLMKGSRNHMRSFSAQLERQGETYIPTYISDGYYDQILKYNRESAVITDPDYKI